MALAELREGETVLDLGSGGGIDVLLSAKRVGATGKAYGLDMTDEMLALANDNKARAGATNVEENLDFDPAARLAFLSGETPMPLGARVVSIRCRLLSGARRNIPE